MAVRCRYPEPSGRYRGYVHTEEEDPDQREEDPDQQEEPPEGDVSSEEDIDCSASESSESVNENMDNVSVVSWDSSIEAFAEEFEQTESFDDSSVNSENIADVEDIHSHKHVHALISSAPFTIDSALELLEHLGCLNVENYIFIQNFIKEKLE